MVSRKSGPREGLLVIPQNPKPYSLGMHIGAAHASVMGRQEMHGRPFGGSRGPSKSL